MIGILIQLAISWLLLHFLFRKDFRVLGLLPTKHRLLEFALGFLAAATMALLYFQLQMRLSGGRWLLNESYTFGEFLNTFWYTLKSVLFEEFIFRGALLYILMTRLGSKKACLHSAIAFGIYHWFSYGIIGSPVQMIFVFILTGTWGLMFAYSFIKTNSMFLPIALHLGWNAVSMIVFSQGGIGAQLLTGVGGEPLSDLISLAVFLLQWLGLPLVVFTYLKSRSSKEMKEPIEDNES